MTLDMKEMPAAYHKETVSLKLENFYFIPVNATLDLSSKGERGVACNGKHFYSYE